MKIAQRYLSVENVISETMTTNRHNWNPTGFSTAGLVRITPQTSERTITGFLAPSDRRMIIIVNIGTNNLILSDESGSSTAANRFALNGDQTLAPDECGTIMYDTDSSRWRLIGRS